MPQLFQVLKCFRCSVFQVHPTKKSTKWECKLCGEKQSMKRHYGLGNGKECRLHVQKLNGLRGEIAEKSETIDQDLSDLDIPTKNTQISPNVRIHYDSSKWSEFIDKNENETNSNEPMYLGDTEVVLEVPAKKRKFTKPKSTQNTRNVRDSNTTNIYDKRKSPSPPPIILYENKISVRNVELVENTVATTAELNIRKDKKYTKPNFIPEKMNKTSKWAQFANEEQDDESPEINYEENVENNSDEIPNKTNSIISSVTRNQQPGNDMFTLCDENDLDDVLSF